MLFPSRPTTSAHMGKTATSRLTWLIAEALGSTCIRATCTGPMLSSAPKLMQSRSKKFKTSLQLRMEDPCQFEHRPTVDGCMCVGVLQRLSLVGYCTLSSCLYSSGSAKPSLKERPSPQKKRTNSTATKYEKNINASQTPQPDLKSVATQTQLVLILEDLPARSCKILQVRICSASAAESPLYRITMICTVRKGNPPHTL